MLNVALTGNIAAGKSTVTEYFRRWGATIIDADLLAREAQAPGNAVLTAIVQRFGSDVLAKDGTLDRNALRGKVMGDDEALAALNAIVHPAVKQRRDELHDTARRRGDILLINDIPLLFEAVDPAQFDAIVLVDAPVAVRRTRLRSLRGLTNEDADRMIAAQMPAERKRAQSHYVIENDGTIGELEARALETFIDLRRRAAGPKEGTLLLLSAGAKDGGAALEAIGARYNDAGARVERVSRTPTFAKAFRTVTPAASVATAAAQDAARAAWEAASRPGPLYVFADGADPAAERLDLRPWGHAPVALLPSRADLW